MTENENVTENVTDTPVDGHTEVKQGKQLKKNTRRLTVAVYAVLFACLYAIVNWGAFSGWLQTILDVISPVVIGLAIAYLCNPILQMYELHIFKKMRFIRLRRILSMLCTYLTVILILVAFFALVVPELMSSVSVLEENYTKYIRDTVDSINSFIDDFTSSGSETVSEYIKVDDIKKAIQNFFFKSDDVFKEALDLLTSYGSRLVSSVTTVLLSLMISIYFLYSKEKRSAQCCKALAALFSEKKQQAILSTAKKVDSAFGGFIEGKILDSLIIGILTYFVMLIFRMPYPVLIAFIVGCTNIVPVFGPIVGGIISGFFVFIIDPGKLIPLIIIVFIIQQLDGNIIGPKILGNNVGVSSFCVIISITIMGNLFGITGMIIGVPVFAVAIELITDFLDRRLESKGLPTDAAQFIPEDNGMLSIPQKEKKSFFRKVASLFGKKSKSK